MKKIQGLSLFASAGVGEAQDVVPREEYNKVVETLNSATELNRRLSDIIQSSIQAQN